MADPVDVDLTMSRPFTSLTKTFFEGLPTARLAAATNFGSVLSCVIEAVRTKALAPLPGLSAFANGVVPADPEWCHHPRPFALVTLTSGLIAQEWKVVGASINFGIDGLYCETREFAPGGREANARSLRGSFKREGSFDLELMKRLISSFENEK